MFQRITALVLALFVASPACWCCAEQPAAKSPVKRHSCCEQKAENESAPAQSGDQRKAPCPCALSQTKRDQQSVQTAVPTPTWTLAAVVPAFQEEVLMAPTMGLNGMSRVPLDTGPPDSRPPLYKRYLALLN